MGGFPRFAVCSITKSVQNRATTPHNCKKTMRFVGSMASAWVFLWSYSFVVSLLIKQCNLTQRMDIVIQALNYHFDRHAREGGYPLIRIIQSWISNKSIWR